MIDPFAHDSFFRVTGKPVFRWFLVLLILFPVFYGGACRSSSGIETRQGSTIHTYGPIAFRLPDSWVQKGTVSRPVFTHTGSRLQQVTIERTTSGDSYEHLHLDVDTGRNRRELADREIRNIRSSPRWMDVRVLEENAVERLGTKGLRQKLRVTDSRGLSYILWNIISVKRGNLYRLSLLAEEKGQYPAYRDAFREVLSTVRLRT